MQKSHRSLSFLIAGVISLSCIKVNAQDTRTRRIELRKMSKPRNSEPDVIVDSNLVSVPVIVSDLVVTCQT
jgi:hypothetical protein